MKKQKRKDPNKMLARFVAMQQMFMSPVSVMIHFVRTRTSTPMYLCVHHSKWSTCANFEMQRATFSSNLVEVSQQQVF